MNGAVGELRHNGQNKVRAIVAHPQNRDHFLIQKKWGKTEEPASTFISKYGASELCRLLQGERWGKKALYVENAMEAMEAWRAQCIKDGFTFEREVHP